MGEREYLWETAPPVFTLGCDTSHQPLALSAMVLRNTHRHLILVLRNQGRLPGRAEICLEKWKKWASKVEAEATASIHEQIIDKRKQSQIPANSKGSCHLSSGGVFRWGRARKGGIKISRNIGSQKLPSFIKDHIWRGPCQQVLSFNLKTVKSLLRIEPSYFLERSPR